MNSITHPAIARKMFLSVLTYWLKGHKICVVDNPLLIEGGMYKWMGKVVIVYWCVSIDPFSRSIAS